MMKKKIPLNHFRPMAAASGLAMLAALAGCTGKEELEATKAQMQVLEDELRQLEEANDETIKQLLNDIEAKNAAISESESRAAEAQVEAEALRERLEELDKLQSEFEEYKEQYKLNARANAVGRELPMMATLNGKRYVNVKVREVNAAGLEIFHQFGAAFVAFNQLSEEVQHEFGYSPNEAVAFIKNEKPKEEKYAEELAAIEVEAKVEREAEKARAKAALEAEKIYGEEKELRTLLAQLDAKIRATKADLESLEYLGKRAQAYGKRSAEADSAIPEKSEELTQLESRRNLVATALDALR